MATFTPPPYFPQGSLAPPDKNRYRQFKLALALAVLLLLMGLVGIGIGVWYLAKWVF